MPTDYSSKDYDFYGDTATDFSDHLAEMFQLQEDNVLVLESDLALSNLILHGTGRTASGCRLAVGTGLSVHVSNGYFVVDGKIGQIDEQVGYSVGSLTDNSTNHLYMDIDGLITTYSSKQGSNPSGTWYLGTAVTNGGECTTVDDSTADILESLTDFRTELDTAKDDIDAIEAAVGMPYPDGNASLDSRVTALESGGGGGGGTVYWGALKEASGDPTTIEEYVAAQIGAAGGGGGGDGQTPETITVQMPSDIEIANHLRLTMRLMHALPEVEETQIYSYYYVPGISATGLCDLDNTTATIDTVNHRIG